MQNTAKEILRDICERATLVPRCTRVTSTVEGIRVSLHLTSLTDGVWVLRFPNGEDLTTISVFEAEIKLDEALQKVEVMA